MCGALSCLRAFALLLAGTWYLPCTHPCCLGLAFLLFSFLTSPNPALVKAEELALQVEAFRTPMGSVLTQNRAQKQGQDPWARAASRSICLLGLLQILWREGRNSVRGDELPRLKGRRQASLCVRMRTHMRVRKTTLTVQIIFT